jgi:hypothetical protein
LTSADINVDGQGATKLLGLGLPSGIVAWRESARHAPLTFDDDVQALAEIAFEMLTGEEPGALEFDSRGAAYLIDPDVPRNASEIVSIGLGAGTARFSSAGAFARSLSDWRSFEPAEYYVAPNPPPAPVAASPQSEQTERATGLNLDIDDWPEDDELLLTGEIVTASRSDRAVRMALVAALLLAMLAGIVVWRGADAAAGPSTVIPAQLDALAELGGF